MRLSLLLLAAFTAFGQNQVNWTLSLEPGTARPGAKVLARMTGRIDDGWHIYSMSTPEAIPTTIQVSPNAVVDSSRVLQPQPKRPFDPTANAETETYSGQVTFLVELTLKKDAAPGPADLTITARYQTCNDQKCIPPVKRPATATLTVDASAPAVALNIPAGYAERKPPKVGQALSPASSSSTAQDQGWWAFLAVAFGFGLATIFTPCVFPMIPITVSYFLNQQGAAEPSAAGTKRAAVSQAV
ncbi:MAG: redoxin, partial [Acidobacteriia bacterium]|nr:redoxin [Terriglobia bacterium]